MWDGELTSAQVISMSSGSSGQPFFWPRGRKSVAESATLHEMIFNQGFNTKNQPTLAVIAFAMGTWIAGTYTFSALTELSSNGHKIVSVTPGIMKEEIIKIFKTIARDYEQTILFGYPPFVKDVIDAAVDEKIDLARLNMKLVLAGENISEKWRDYVLRQIKTKDLLHTAFSIYGTADAGFLGAETPLSIYFRRALSTDQQLQEELFPGAPILPTLIEYIPEMRFFEQDEDALILTTDGGLPLIRYDIKDKGRIMSGDTLLSKLRKGNNSAITKKVSSSNPYLALYGRSDVAATFYALNIYPENVKYGLETISLEKYVTGKFIIKTEYDELTQDQSLHIYVEVKKDVTPNSRIEKGVFKHIFKSLLINNSEYSKLHQEIQDVAEPIIHLVRFGSTEFKAGVKHRWVAKP